MDSNMPQYLCCASLVYFLKGRKCVQWQGDGELACPGGDQMFNQMGQEWT